MKIRRMIRRCFVSGNSVDDKEYQIAQVQAYRKTVNADVLMSYGIAANVPQSAPGILFLTNGMDDNRFVILGNSPAWRPRNLKSGELVIGNFITGDVVKFLEDKIEILGSNDLDVNITGDVNVTIGGDANIDVGGDANITAAGNLTIDAATIAFNSDNFTINATAAFNVNAPLTNINSASTNLGIGGKQIARVGDPVLVGIVTGVIVDPNTSTNTST